MKIGTEQGKNITIIPGNLLDSTAQVLGHQTNCEGVMGAGVARAIREKYPEIMIPYKEACQARLMLGECQMVQTTNGPLIANLFGQNGCGRSGRLTDYTALQSALSSLVRQMTERHLDSVALPYKIGCGLAGGSWDIVFKMIQHTFTGVNISVELWKIQ